MALLVLALAVSVSVCSSAFAGVVAGNQGKLWRAAVMIASEIERKVPKGPAGQYCLTCHKGLAQGMTTVAVEIQGKGAEAREAEALLIKQLTAIDHGFRVIAGGTEAGADVFIKGSLLRYKGKNRWRLSLKAFGPGGSAVAAYEGFLIGE